MTVFQYGSVTLRSLDNWPAYWCGDDGRVYSTKKGLPRPLKPQLNRKNRIWAVSLYRDDRRYDRKLASGKIKSCQLASVQPVHTLIASVWLPPRPSPAHEVNHIDLDRTNNRPTNLEWVTKPMNVAHFKAARPLAGVGQNHPKHKLTEPEVVAIRALEGKLSRRLIADMFHVSLPTVDSIFNRRTWRHI